MSRRILQRLLHPIAQIQEKEIFTAFLMFSYSFLAMTAHNIAKPISRSQFIRSLGSDNMPYVQLAVGVLAGVVMTGYAWLMRRLPRRWCLPIAQSGIVAILIAFWYLFRTGWAWTSVPFYFLVQLLGVLLISQFWTLANVVYEPRQAKRLFGFIGAGASLGGLLGSYLDMHARQIYTVNLVLYSAGAMALCLVVVVLVIRREQVSELDPSAALAREKGVGARRSFDLLVKSKHLRIIALVISCAAIGAGVIEQQFNMAVDAIKGRQNADAMTEFFGRIQLYVSACGFLLQVLLTSRIHRYLGIGFALILLPMTMGTTATIILFNYVLWAPATARFIDQSLRYTVDKTTREILYMPLSAEIKFEAKPFVDVTVDRFAKALGAILMLVAIKPWGLGMTWQNLSYGTAGLTILWLFIAWHAKRGYQQAFRQSIEARVIRPTDVRLGVADLSTIETLIRELASPDEDRVLYAVEMLESLDKRNLISPLLLYHESPAVKVRALGLLCNTLAHESARWLPTIRRMMADENPEVRAAAVGALANIHDEQITDLVRPYLNDPNPRIAITAAMVLSDSSREEDVTAAGQMLKELVSDARDSASHARREYAIALRSVPHPHFRHLLIPLLTDSNHEVAEEAMGTVRHLATTDYIFVPTLISLLRNHRLKSAARELLVGYGENVLPILGHFLRDPEEDVWIRRHIPGTIAQIPGQKAMDILIGALGESDGHLRFRVLAAIEKLHRDDAGLVIGREYIESQALKEGSHYLYYQDSYRRLFDQEKLPADSLLARALKEKMERTVDRIYRFLGLIYPWKDIAAARWAAEQKRGRSSSAALEYLDNVLTGALRKKLMPVLEGATTPAKPLDLSAKTKEVVLRLIQDSDPVLSSAAILFAWQIRLGSVNSELENLLATRDAGDWHVFEAASWVSAAFRLQESRRRSLWIEAMPTVEAAERMRTLPLFSSLSVDSLFRIAGAGTQVRQDAGKVLFHEDSVPECLHILLDGKIVCLSVEGTTRDVPAPAILGFHEVLEGKPAGETARAAETVVCLALTGDEIRTLLADDTEWVEGLFRTLLGGDAIAGVGPIIHGERSKPVPAVQASGLNAIEKALVLRNIPAFSRVSPAEMPGLASIATEIHLAAESILFGETDPPSIYALVSGELALESSTQDQPVVAVPEDTVGIEHTLAGVSLRRKARVQRDGTALCIGGEDLFDLMSQRPDLLSQLYGAVSEERASRAAKASA